MLSKANQHVRFGPSRAVRLRVALLEACVLLLLQEPKVSYHATNLALDWLLLLGTTVLR